MGDVVQKDGIYDKIMLLQKLLLTETDEWEENMPPVTHHFGPKVYLREIEMKANEHTFVIGCKHKTEHFNIVLTGRASVLMDYEKGEWQEIKAPAVFISKPGVKKVLKIHEDMRWLTVHPLDEDKTEEDLPELEELLTEEPPSKMHAEAKTIKELRRLSLARDRKRRLA